MSGLTRDFRRRPAPWGGNGADIGVVGVPVPSLGVKQGVARA